MYVGDEKQLEIEYTPKNTVNVGVIWQVSDETIATVDALGVIKALKEESNTFSGQDLLNIHQHNLKDKNTQLALKKINKSVIDELLQGRELKSRLLYQQFMAVK